MKVAQHARKTRAYSPNQSARRDYIIAATRRLMASRGPGGCTARAIADAASVSTSALHYYFVDVRELKEIAFRQINDAFVTYIVDSIASRSDPLEKIWAGARAFLEYSLRLLPALDHADPSPGRHVNFLWREFEIEAARGGDLTTLAELANWTGAIFPPLFEAAGFEEAAVKADVFFLALVASSERERLYRRPVDAVLDDLSKSFAIPRAA